MVGAIGALHEAALPQNVQEEVGGLGPSPVGPDDDALLVAGQIAGAMLVVLDRRGAPEGGALLATRAATVADLAAVRRGARQEGPKRALAVATVPTGVPGPGGQEARAAATAGEAGASVDVREGGVPPAIRPRKTMGRRGATGGTRVAIGPGDVVEVELSTPVHDANGAIFATEARLAGVPRAATKVGGPDADLADDRSPDAGPNGLPRPVGRPRLQVVHATPSRDAVAVPLVAVVATGVRPVLVEVGPVLLVVVVLVVLVLL